MTPDEFDCLPMDKKKAIRASLSELGKSACEYAEMGWHVFPLKTRSKEPDIPNGFKDASDDWEFCCWFWNEYPDRNIGLVTGKPSGFFVIDIDQNEDKGKYGQDNLDDWESENGKLPDTVCAVTGSGGTHYLYRTSSSVNGTTNQMLNIDIKGDGGYIVAPPSIHPDGGSYYWDVAPYDEPIAMMDSTVMSLMAYVYNTRSDAASTHGEGRFEFPDCVHDGEGREQNLLTYAFSLRSQGLGQQEIERELSKVNEERVIPPKRKSDLRRIARSVCKKPAGLSPEYQKAKERAERRKAEEAERAAAEYEQSVKAAKLANAEPEREPIDPDAFKFGRNGLDHAKVGTDMLDRFCAKKIDGTPAVWTDGRYETGWTPVKRLVDRYKFNAKESERNEVVRWLELHMPEERQGDKRYISFKNGILDLSTMTLLPNSPSLNVTNQIPHRWNPDAHCPSVDSFLAGISCCDPDTMTNMCEMIGMCMTRKSVIAKAFFLINFKGNNGKSTFLNFLRGILGNENCSSIEFHMLGERFQTTPIMGKVANIADDIPADLADKKAMGVFKKLVTSDRVAYEVKGGIQSDFTPMCTVVFSMNKMPPLGEFSGGIERRIHPVAFKANFGDGSADLEMADKLSTEEAYEYAIVLGVNAYANALRNGCVTKTDYSTEELERIKLDNNSIALFLEDNGYDAESLHTITTEHLYGEYVKWADGSGVRNVYSRRNFTRGICDNVGNMKAVKTTAGTKENVWRFVIDEK